MRSVANYLVIIGFTVFVDIQIVDCYLHIHRQSVCVNMDDKTE